MSTINVGVIGCGNISDAYFKAAAQFSVLKMVACAEIYMTAAEAKAETYGLKAMSVDEHIDIVLNLTTPHPSNIIDYRVQITKPDDSIVVSVEDFDYHSEQYYLHIDPAIEVLATTTFTGEYDAHINGVVMPVVWKHKYHKARVFYSALGHTADEFKHPQMRTILERGLLWAAR